MTNLQKITKVIKPVLKSHQVKKAAIFGSYARGEQKEKSDIDLLVEFRGNKSLFDMLELQFKLQDIVGRKVDILTFDSINPLIKPFIKDQIRVL